MSVTPLVDLLIAVFNNSAISGATTNCTHGVTHITQPVKFPKISTRAKRDSLVLIFWGISTGDVIYSNAPGPPYNARVRLNQDGSEKGAHPVIICAMITRSRLKIVLL